MMSESESNEGGKRGLRGIMSHIAVFMAGVIVSSMLDEKILMLHTVETIARVDSRNVSLNSFIQKDCEPPAAELATQTPNSVSPKTPFDKIVETAYSQALKDVATTRNEFSVEYWEKESNLTTAGGLQHNDRIELGKIYGEANSVFEYGLGESTYIANYVGVPRYAGTDSDPVWVGMARQKVSPHFRFYLSDVGKTGAWGYPHNSGLQKSVLNYQLGPLIVEPKPFDVYMVDGRWRLPCMLASFLHASARGADPQETTVLLHDCTPNNKKGRMEYQNADHLLNITKHSGAKLCIYKRLQSTTDEQLAEAWHQYKKQLKRM